MPWRGRAPCYLVACVKRRRQPVAIECGEREPRKLGVFGPFRCGERPRGRCLRTLCRDVPPSDRPRYRHYFLMFLCLVFLNFVPDALAFRPWATGMHSTAVGSSNIRQRSCVFAGSTGNLIMTCPRNPVDWDDLVQAEDDRSPYQASPEDVCSGPQISGAALR